MERLPGAPEIFGFPGAPMPLIDDFTAQAQDSGYKKVPPRQRIKRPAPFSLRLSEAERARLTAEAKGAPLGAYIKAKVLGSPLPSGLRRSGLTIEDRKAFAQALALLGQSRLSSNLNQLARAVNLGVLPVTPETDEDLRAACRAVVEIRGLLMTALGTKAGATP